MQENDNPINRKYELTDGTVTTSDGRTLHRIRAVRDFNTSFGIVKAGQLGGFVESEHNLSHDQAAWISDDAEVSGHAQVSDNALVSGNAWVFENSLVSGNAWVFGNAMVSGYARVSDDTQVFEDAHVDGDAQVCDDAQISGNGRVSGNARVSRYAQVSGNAHVYGHARVYENAKIYEGAKVFGNAEVLGDARVFGNAWVYGDAQVFGDAQVYGYARLKNEDLAPGTADFTTGGHYTGGKTKRDSRIDISGPSTPRTPESRLENAPDDSLPVTETLHQPGADAPAKRHVEALKRPEKSEKSSPLAFIDNMVVETFPPHRGGVRER